MSEKTIKFKVLRQSDPDSSPYEEEFEVPYRPNMNVISALMEFRRNPVNINGEKTTPIAWDMNCLEEVCGACSMVINGKLVNHVQRLLISSSSRFDWSR